MLLLFPTATSRSEPEGLKCPNPDVLMKTTEKDKDELSQALLTSFQKYMAQALIIRSGKLR